MFQYPGVGSGAIDSIDSAKLNDAAQKLLVPTSLRGGTLTVKQRLKREKAMYDAGLALSDDAMLFKRRGGALGENQQVDNTNSQHSPCEQLPDSKGIATVSQNSADDDTSPTHAIVDGPADFPARAPPISVSFSKRSKMTQPQQDNESAEQRPHVADEDAMVSVAALSQEQQQAVSQAKKELIASGEMKGAATSHTMQARQPKILLFILF